MNGPVVCGIEDTGGASVAAVARELAERYELPLLYVHVLDGADGDERVARLLRETPSGYGDLAIESGHPADRLVQVAGEQRASFVVVGNRGPRSSLLGSVSADVSRRAPCPVIVVPPSADSVAPARVRAGANVEGGIVRFGLGAAVGAGER